MLPPRENLLKLFDYVKTLEEPGVAFAYDVLPISLGAMRIFLIESPAGKQLLSYYKNLLQVQGKYIVTRSEELAFDLVVKMTRSFFTRQDDPQLTDHILAILPEAAETIVPYTENERRFFEIWASGVKERLKEKCAKATSELVTLKSSEEFSRKHRQLLKAHEVHEAKLAEFRRRDAYRKNEREAKLRSIRGRNNQTIRRQMGMNGMTSHTPHVEQSVVDYVQETSNDFFPHADNEDVGTEEQMVRDPG
jgi:hypothetical protein